jgi:hypothetical protein
MLVLVLSAGLASSQGPTRAAPELRWSIEGAAGVVEFVSAELRYAFFARKRVSPYAVVGTGRGVERPNVDELFPYGVDRKIVAIYYGAGARVPIHRRLDAFADWRLIITGDDAAEMAAFRFRSGRANCYSRRSACARKRENAGAMPTH